METRIHGHGILGIVDLIGCETGTDTRKVPIHRFPNGGSIQTLVNTSVTGEITAGRDSV